MILVIDNYDSFTYNLVQYMGELVAGEDMVVFRNDAVTVEEVLEMAPRRIVLSPGPGHPDEAGICLELVKNLQGRVPLLGVCLGHQAIGRACGAVIRPAYRLMHGKVSQITHNGEELFQGLEPGFPAARYHSLAVSPDNLPRSLCITARSEDGEIMALKHRHFPLWGIQFHPESILTRDGKMILANFLQGKGAKQNDQRSAAEIGSGEQP